MKFRTIKFRRTENGPIEIHLGYMCPGCGYEHIFNPSVHRFNGNMDKPTVSPSLLQSNPQNHHTCHSFIMDGRIQFLGDCWHKLKGQTVDLLDWPEDKLHEYDDVI